MKLVIVGNPTSYSLGFAEGDNTNITFTTTFDSVSMSVPPVKFVEFPLFKNEYEHSTASV